MSVQGYHRCRDGAARGLTLEGGRGGGGERREEETGETETDLGDRVDLYVASERATVSVCVLERCREPIPRGGAVSADSPRSGARAAARRTAGGGKRRTHVDRGRRRVGGDQGRRGGEARHSVVRCTVCARAAAASRARARQAGERRAMRTGNVTRRRIGRAGKAGSAGGGETECSGSVTALAEHRRAARLTLFDVRVAMQKVKEEGKPSGGRRASCPTCFRQTATSSLAPPFRPNTPLRLAPRYDCRVNLEFLCICINRPEIIPRRQGRGRDPEEILSRSNTIEIESPQS